MTRYLLDTNIVSDAAKPRPSASLSDWMSRQYDDALFISAHSLGEIWFGIVRLPPGRRREGLSAWFQGPVGPPLSFAGRIFPYDDPVALRWAEIIAEAQAAGRSRDPWDMIIAATALVNDCVLVTDNERDFEGVVEVINPVRGAIL